MNSAQIHFLLLISVLGACDNTKQASSSEESGGATPEKVEASNEKLPEMPPQKQAEALPKVVAKPDKPSTPKALAKFTDKPEITFQWTAAELSAAALQIVAYRVELAKLNTMGAPPQILKQQDLADSTAQFAISDEGLYSLRVLSVDAIGQASEYSDFSDAVLVDRTPPSPAQIQNVIFSVESSQLQATINFTPSQDGPLGSPVEELSYRVCYASQSQDISSLSDCEAALSPTSAKGTNTIKLSNIAPASQASSQFSFRVLTQDQTGHKSLSNLMLAFYTAPAVNPND